MSDSKETPWYVVYRFGNCTGGITITTSSNWFPIRAVGNSLKKKHNTTGLVIQSWTLITDEQHEEYLDAATPLRCSQM